MIKDPRVLIIKERLKDIDNVIAVVSPKGGVGKTVISASLSIALADLNFATRLLDLDITNPTAHIVLGIDVNSIMPKEERGVKPPEVWGVKFMSIAFYSKDKATPLRGPDIINSIREVLAITIWGSLKYLIIDTPPGFSDEVLEILNLMKPKALVVTTPSPLSIKSTERLLEVLKDSKTEVIGIIENMSKNKSTVNNLCNRFSVKCLGRIPFINNLDELIMKPTTLFKSNFMDFIKKVAKSIVEA